MSSGFKPGAFSCCNKDGNLVTDVNSKLKLYRAQFPEVLYDNDVKNSSNNQEPARLSIVADNYMVPSPNVYVVTMIIQRLKKQSNRRG